MRTLISLAILGVSTTSNDAASDFPSLVAVMQALQAPMKDFRCEFEGEDFYRGERAEVEAKRLGADGLAQTFGGVFVWQRDGDRRVDVFTRGALSNHIMREIIVVHLRDKKMERSHQVNDGSIGNVDIEPLAMTTVNTASYFGELLPLDQLKGALDRDNREMTVTDDEIDGRPLKLLTVYLKFEGRPNILVRRYWIDLSRSGQAVRIDSYFQGALASQWDIVLKSFRVGDADIWMPISGEFKNYAGGMTAVAKAPLAERAPTMLRSLKVLKEPTLLRSVRVIAGTMEFNKKPNPSMFKLKHKPGTPISDQIRKLNYQFGQKQTSNRPTRSESEKMLQEQIAEAEEQRRELVAVSREGIDWWTWSVAGLAATLSASLAVLWFQRRPH